MYSICSENAGMLPLTTQNSGNADLLLFTVFAASGNEEMPLFAVLAASEDTNANICSICQAKSSHTFNKQQARPTPFENKNPSADLGFRV